MDGQTDTQNQNTAWIADSGLFIACGRQQNNKYIALSRFATTNEITFLIPQRVYDELGGAPAPSTPGQTPVNSAIDAGWVAVADQLDYTTPAVAAVMDDVRSYIAHASNRPEDQIEKADTALAGVAVQRLARDDIPAVSVVTTDTDAGAGVKRAVEAAGFEGQISIRDGFAFIDEIT
jgi:hypothetical protein